MLQMLHALLYGDLAKKDVAVQSGAKLGSNTFSFIFKVPREDTLVHQQEGSLCKDEIIDPSFRFLASSLLFSSLFSTFAIVSEGNVCSVSFST